MTEAQREDLYLEWELTPSKLKQQIRKDYFEKYGSKRPQGHWEEYLVNVLNLKQMWEGNGMM